MGFVPTAALRLPRGSRFGIALAALLVVLLAPAKSHAQTYTWNLPGSGNWVTAGNWTPGGGPPNAASTVAVFGNSITANSTITLPAGGVTVGELRFHDVNAGTNTVAYTIAAGQTLTFNNGGSPSQINVTGFTRGNQTINAAISIAGGQPLNITNNGAPGLTTLTIGAGGISATTAGTALNIDGAANTIISGIINASVGTLTKSGSGVLTLTAANGYTGGTVITGGVVSVSNNNQLGTTGVNGTVTLNGGGIHFTSNAFSSGREFIIGVNGGTFLSSVAPTIFGQTATLTGVISGASGTGPVTFDGGQFLELRGANTYEGATIVNDAGVLLTNGGQLLNTTSITINGFTAGRIGLIDLLNGGAPNSNRLPDGVPITLNGGLLSYLPGTSTSTTEAAGVLTVKGYGLLYGNQSTTGPAGTLAFDAISRFDEFSTLYVGGKVNGPAIGSVQITFASGLAQEPGSGTQVVVVPWIGGDLGLVDISSGTVRATGIPETLYTYNDTFGLIALDASNYEQITAGLAMEAGRNNSLIGNPLAVNSPLSHLALIVSPTAPGTGVTVTGTSTLTIANAAIANTLPLIFDGPTVAFDAKTGYIWLGDNLTVRGTSQITGSNGLVVSSNLNNTLYALRLENTANTFTGGLYLNGTGKADFDTSDAQLRATGQIISFRGGSLHYSGNASITLATSSNNRPLVMSAAGGGVVIVEILAATLTVPGLVSGPEQLTKSGGGTLSLTNTANTYAGGTTIAEGTLAIAGPGSLGSGNVTLGRPGFVGASLRFDFSGAVSTNITQAASGSLNTGSNNVTLSGVISGAVTGTLTKLGTGTLTLSSANTYTASTSVSAGTLLVTNTTGSGTGYGPVAVTAGAALGGTGTVAGPVSVSGADSRLIVGMPGGTGTLTLRGRTNTLAATSTFQTHLAGTTAGTGYAQLVITSGGAITLTNPTLDATLGYTPSPADKLFLIDNRNATGGLTGMFFGLAQGATYTFANGTTAVISYTGDFGTGALTGGNDVVFHGFVPVSEPATVLGIGALAIGGLMWRKRRGTATLAV